MLSYRRVEIRIFGDLIVVEKIMWIVGSEFGELVEVLRGGQLAARDKDTPLEANVGRAHGNPPIRQLSQH